MTLVLGHNRHCLVVGAICTSDGRRLSNRLELTVQFAPPGVPEPAHSHGAVVGHRGPGVERRPPSGFL